jgi:thiol-disulfide isomerase/thioredoxin
MLDRSRRGSLVLAGVAAVAAASLSMALIGAETQAPPATGGAGTGAAAPPAAKTAVPKPESFPDDWFFYGEKRPDKLRAMEGKPAPKITAETWVGDEVDIAKLKGKVVIVDFWGTWCPPCRKAIPKNVQMVKEYGETDMVFVAVHDARRGWDKAPAMITDTGINYPVALDKKAEDGSGISTKAFGVSFWPTYIAIDRSGTIRAVGLRPDKVEDVVKILLAEPMPAKAAPAAPAARATGTTGG